MSKKDEALPSVDSVLNKLKSDGTFDQFRRTCLSHIQGEPSFRAYSEHMEVVSRRYLQNYKWKDSSTKNEVRGKLRDHALGVIVSPDIQVGTPLIDIVEKVLESKAKELLPKITEAVDFISESRAKQLKEAEIKKESTLLPVQSAIHGTEAPKSDFVDLSLPIDIPGLSTTTIGVGGKKESQGGGPPVKKENQGGGVAGKKEGSESKLIKMKQKGAVETLKTGNKNSSLKTGGKDSGKVKNENKEQKSSMEPVTKEKPKLPRIPKKQKVDKDNSDKPDKQEKENPHEINKEVPDESKISTKFSGKDKKRSAEEFEPTLKRRSARLASHTESKASSENEDEEANTEMEVHEPPRRKRHKTSGSVPSKKKPKMMISSSSEDSEVEEGSSGGYETDTDQPSEEERSLETEHVKKKRKLHKKTERQKSQMETSDTKGSSSKSKRSRVNPPLRASKSPPVIVTRYNRSVKPNPRYYNASVEMEPTEEDSQSTLTETEGDKADLHEDKTIVRPLIPETTRSCDIDTEIEILKGALSLEEGHDVAYEMTTPKPTPLKVRKTLMKGLRSRKKTKTRISFFCHR